VSLSVARLPPPLREGARPAQPLLWLAVLASCALAYLTPYDLLFDRLTLNLPVARSLAMLGCWLGGLWLLRANGFSLVVVGMWRPALEIGCAAAAMALWCVAMDGLLFRSMLPPAYFTWEHQPLAQRLLYYCTRAFNENVLYRLFLGSLFAWLLRRIWRKPGHALALSMLGMSAAHLVNVAVNLGWAGADPAILAWLLLRFMVPGIAWSWLYVRHGFVANEAAAIGVHCILQPLVSLAFLY
jgi:hypothetical protein